MLSCGFFGASSMASHRLRMWDLVLLGVCHLELLLSVPECQLVLRTGGHVFGSRLQYIRKNVI